MPGKKQAFGNRKYSIESSNWLVLTPLRSTSRRSPEALARQLGVALPRADAGGQVVRVVAERGEQFRFARLFAQMRARVADGVHEPCDVAAEDVVLGVGVAGGAQPLGMRREHVIGLEEAFDAPSSSCRAAPSPCAG